MSQVKKKLKNLNERYFMAKIYKYQKLSTPNCKAKFLSLSDDY